MKAQLACAITVVGLVAGCRGQPSKEPPIHPIRNMAYTQPRYDTQSRSEFFRDGRTMRHLVPGTVAREMETDVVLATGRQADGEGWILDIPPKMVRRHGDMKQLLKRGQDRYNIYCAPCHGMSGDGDGMVARRAAELGAAVMSPPTFHQERLRHIPDGQLYATITNGVRNMPAYRHSIPLDDRWAIVGYVRALQLSQKQQKTAHLSTGEDQP